MSEATTGPFEVIGGGASDVVLGQSYRVFSLSSHRELQNGVFVPAPNLTQCTFTTIVVVRKDRLVKNRVSYTHERSVNAIYRSQRWFSRSD